MHIKPGHVTPEGMGKKYMEGMVSLFIKSQINNESKLMGNHWSPYKLLSYYDSEQFEIDAFIYFHIHVTS